MNNKRAQQSVGMSFNLIFSLVLIIAFIVFAFVAIKFFMNMQETAQLVQFYENLQSEINSARSSTTTEKYFEIKLPKKITHVCFANMTKERTAPQHLASQITSHAPDFNVYLIPQKKLQNHASKRIEYLDIEAITENQNPYCVETNTKLLIKKEAFSKLVIIS